MSEFVGVWAEISLPPEQIDRWLADAVDNRWKDWVGPLELLNQHFTGQQGTVRELFKEAARRLPKPDYVEWSARDGQVKVRALLTLPDTWDGGAQVCMALRHTEKFGGTGEVVAVGILEESLNAQLMLGKGGSRCQAAPAKRREEVISEFAPSPETASGKTHRTRKTTKNRRG